MSTSQITHLSLLSRGIGEVQETTENHQKIEIKLEAEDYNNWLDDPRRTWQIPSVIPPIKSSLSPEYHGAPPNTQAHSKSLNDISPRSNAFSVGHSEVYLPKTYTTRKGALLLFSEDFANKQRQSYSDDQPEQSDGPDIHTVDDLAKSILAYGAEGRGDNNGSDVYLGFVNRNSRKFYERQFKPGFSAKRYLFSWSKLWDYSLLQKVNQKGLIKQIPNQKKSDGDVSGIPLPYRILRQWLYAPGTIDGYTFYRQNRQPTTEIQTREPTMIEESPRPNSVSSTVSQGSIQVTSLLGNTELKYKELDSGTKESILTELLVKSAITHAINKQKEYQETVSKSLDDEDMKRKASARLYEFNMMQAIEAALDNSHVPTVTTTNFDPQGLLPEDQQPKKIKNGFKGTKGMGIQPASAICSAPSATPGRSPFEKHVVLPPISAKKSKAGSDVAQEAFMTIPTVQPESVHGQTTAAGGLTVDIQIEPPTPQQTMIGGFKGFKPSKSASRKGAGSTIHSDDDEYHSWRESALSSGHHQTQSTSLNQSKNSKSLQSLTRVNMEAEPVTQVALADDAENLLNNTNTSNPNKPMLTTDSSCVKLNRSKSADTNPKHHPENDPIDNVNSTEPRSKSAPNLLQFHQQPGKRLDQQQQPIIIRTQSAQDKPSSPQSGSAVPQVAARSASAGQQQISTKKPPTGRSTSKYTNHFEKALGDLPAAKPIHKTSSINSLVNASDKRRQQLESSTFGEAITPLEASQKDSANTLTVTMTTERKAMKQAYSNVDLINQVGFDGDHDQDDKKSVVSNMSMMSYLSRKSRISGESGQHGASYTKGITARQENVDPSGDQVTDDMSDPKANNLLKAGRRFPRPAFDMIATSFDPTAAITSWRYDVEKEGTYASLKKDEEPEPAPSIHPMESSLATSVATSVRSSSPAALSPFSIPAMSDPRTPIQVPTDAASAIIASQDEEQAESEKSMTDQDGRSQMSENEFMEALTEQAREIAKAVLAGDEAAGTDLAHDAKKAAELLMSSLPGDVDPSRNQSAAQMSDLQEQDETEQEEQKIPNVWSMKVPDAYGVDDVTSSLAGATVGQLVKDGMEELVNKIDVYQMGDKSRSMSTASKGLSTPGRHSIPSADGKTPGYTRDPSRRSSALTQASASSEGTLVPTPDPSIPPADGQLTPQATPPPVTPSVTGSDPSQAPQDPTDQPQEYLDIIVPELSLGLSEDDIKYLNPLVQNPQEILTRLPGSQLRVTEGGMLVEGGVISQGSQAKTPSLVASRVASTRLPSTIPPASGQASVLSSARSAAGAASAHPSEKGSELRGAASGQAGSTVASSVKSAMSATGSVAGESTAASEAAGPGSALSKQSSATSKKTPPKVKHESEFVVGKVKDEKAAELYAPVPSPPKSQPTKTGKANKANKTGNKVRLGNKQKPLTKTISIPRLTPGQVLARPRPQVIPIAKTVVSKPKAKKGGEKKSKTGGKKKVSTTKAPKSPAEQAVKKKTPTPPPPPKEPTPEPPKPPTPTPSPEEWKTPEPEVEDDMEFVIIREEFSDDEEEVKPDLGTVKPINMPQSPEDSTAGSSQADYESDSLDDEDFDEEGIQGLSNREAQAAKRAAAKEKKRRQMERRRREREEAIKKEKEDAERRERIQKQMEEDRLRREEEVRQRKEADRLAREREEEEEMAKLKAQRDAAERERKRQEEMQKYMEEKKRRAKEEEAARKALQAQKEAEEAERLKQEEEMLKAMAEEERLEYLKKKAEEERLRSIAEEEARIKREAEAQRIWEELQAKEEERKRAEEMLRQRLLFQRSLNVESHGLEHSHDMSRAFVFSYYELLKWLGYEIPEWAQFGLTPSNPNNASHDTQHNN